MPLKKTRIQPLHCFLGALVIPLYLAIIPLVLASPVWIVYGLVGLWSCWVTGDSLLSLLPPASDLYDLLPGLAFGYGLVATAAFICLFLDSLNQFSWYHEPQTEQTVRVFLEHVDRSDWDSAFSMCSTTFPCDLARQALLTLKSSVPQQMSNAWQVHELEIPANSCEINEFFCFYDSMVAITFSSNDPHHTTSFRLGVDSRRNFLLVVWDPDIEWFWF